MRKSTVLPATQELLISSLPSGLKQSGRKSKRIASTKLVLMDLRLVPKERRSRSTSPIWKNLDTRKTLPLSTIGSMNQREFPLASSRSNRVDTLFIKFGDHPTSDRDNNKSKENQRLRNSQLVNHGP